MSQLKVNSIVDASGGSNAQLYGVASPPNSMGFRNRILNGGMVIDQRNAGASVTGNNGVFPVDRFKIAASQSSKLTAQQSTTAPTGFSNSLLITSSSAYSVAAGDYFGVEHIIEGFNTSDFGWGTASAQTITLSFWVRSSLTGTFSVSIRNYGSYNRSYAATYTISAANTWEQKTITIAGDTTGTWTGASNNGSFLLDWGLGVGSTYSTSAGSWTAGNFIAATGATSVVGTNGATFYITGVQLEAGTVASPFERRDYGRELMMCQRYAIQLISTTNEWIATGFANSGTNAFATIQLPVVMRSTSQTLTVSSASHFNALNGAANTVTATALTLDRASTRSPNIGITVASGLTQGQGSALYASNASASLVISAEL